MRRQLHGPVPGQLYLLRGTRGTREALELLGVSAGPAPTPPTAAAVLVDARGGDLLRARAGGGADGGGGAGAGDGVGDGADGLGERDRAVLAVAARHHAAAGRDALVGRVLGCSPARYLQLLAAVIEEPAAAAAEPELVGRLLALRARRRRLRAAASQTGA